MTLTINKTHIVALFLFMGVTSFAQQNDAKYLKNFDEERFLAYAKMEKIPADKVKEFVDFFRQQHIYKQKAIESGILQNVNLKVSSGNSNAYCPNLDFEDGSFAGWKGDTAFIAVNHVSSVDTTKNWWTLNPPPWQVGLISPGPNTPSSDPLARQTIMSTPPGNNNTAKGALVGYDPLTIPVGSTISDVPFLAPGGGKYSVRLGNSNWGSETERLVYSISVTPQNRLFTYRYAVVLNNNAVHPTDQQAFFRITIKDASGKLISSGNNTCGYYNVDAANAATDKTFITSKSTGGSPASQVPIYYRKWTTEIIDLEPYMGQTLTIEFRTADCSNGGHFGYAYIDAECGELKIPVDRCVGADPKAVDIHAPTGFHQYQWQGPNNNNNIPGATDSVLHVKNLSPGDTYTVSMYTASNCQSSASVTLEKFNDTLSVQAIYCPGDSSFVLVAPPGFSNYQWYSISNTNGTLIETPISGANKDTLIVIQPTSTYTQYAATYHIWGCRRHNIDIVHVTPSISFYPSGKVNIFTPNSDGKNDKFVPYYDDIYSQYDINYFAGEFDVKIYDRWGRLVYETNDYLRGWDGKYNGKELIDGTYFWIATYKPRCSEKSETKNGFVQLLR